MSEDFSEDFVVEEEETSNRSFLIVAGSLIGVFILLALCVVAYVWLQGNERDDEIAEIEAQNATTEAQNALVTQTVQALETAAAEEAVQIAEAEQATSEAEAAAEEAAQATREAEVAAQATADAEPTLRPTEPVAQTADGEMIAQTATAVAAEVATQESVAATEAAQSGSESATPSAPVTEGEGGSTTLPETGVSTVVFAAIGLGMIVLLFLARRLRVSS